MGKGSLVGVKVCTTVCYIVVATITVLKFVPVVVPLLYIVIPVFKNVPCVLFLAGISGFKVVAVCTVVIKLFL